VAVREINRYQPLKDAQLNALDQNESQQPYPVKEAQTAEDRLAAKEQELEDKVKRGLITRHEMDYALKQFDNALVVEMKLEDERRGEQAPPAHSTPDEPSQDNVQEERPETSAEKEAPAEEHDRNNRGEMTEARAARRDRLRGIESEIKREFREQADSMLDRDNSGERSR
jgi:hypothetical protein